MALAPSLLTIKNVGIGVGLVTLAGLAVTAELGSRSPSSAGLLALVGNAPTIVTDLGPTATPEVGDNLMVGQVPFMRGSLIIYPALPDSDPEQNDLAPTLVWQDTPLPGVGLARMLGLAPAVVGDTGQSIAISVGSAILQGLAPTVNTPAGQSGTTEPDKAEMAFVVAGLEPGLLSELAVSLADNQSESNVLTITGFVPVLSFQTGWTDVPAAEDPLWVDVPRV